MLISRSALALKLRPCELIASARPARVNTAGAREAGSAPGEGVGCHIVTEAAGVFGPHLDRPLWLRPCELIASARPARVNTAGACEVGGAPGKGGGCHLVAEVPGVFSLISTGPFDVSPHPPSSRGPAVLMWVSGSKGSNSSLSRVLWGLLSSKIHRSSNLGPVDVSFSLAGTLAGPVLPETRAVCRGTASYPWAGSSAPALGKCPWLVTGQAAQVEQRRRSAERVQAREFCAPSKRPRPPALCQLHVIRWRFARMPHQRSCRAAPEERSKFCTWLRLERHLPRSVDCAFWKARQAGWASLQE